MSLLNLYLRYQKDWVGRRQPAPPIAIRDTLLSPKRIAVCVGGDPRLPPLTLPAIRLLRSRFDDARFLIAAGPENITAFRRERIADKAIVLHRKKGSGMVSEIQKAGKEMAKLEPDLLLVLDGQPSPELLALAHSSRVPLRIGFGEGESYPFLNFEVVPPKKKPYLAQSLLDMVGAITGRFVDFLDDAVRWKIPEGDARRAERLIHFWQPRSDDLLVALEPAGVDGREPDIAKYASAARLLAKAYGARIMIVTGPEGKPAAEELERRLAFLEPYRAQADDLPQAVAFISRADLAVCTNTPLFHYAVALGVPTLGLFPEKADPWLVPPEGTAARTLPLQREIREEQFLSAVDALGAQVGGSGG